MSITITQTQIINNNGTVVFARVDHPIIIINISNSSLFYNSGKMIIASYISSTDSYYYSEPLSRITILYCQIINNSGLVLSRLRESILVVNYSRIINHQGGIIHTSEASNVFIAHSKAINGSGVAILHNLDTLSGSSVHHVNVCIHDTQFIHNGGGILHSGGFEIAVIIFQSLFVNNTSSLGGVFKLSQSTTMTIINSSFISNTAYNQGGVIHISHDVDVVIIQATFTGNRARKGGVVSLYEVSLIVINSSFTHNSADHEGGVIFCDAGVGVFFVNKTTVIHNSYFWNNTAGLNGGVVMITVWEFNSLWR